MENIDYSQVYFRVLQQAVAADCWFAIAPRADGIIQLREVWVDPYLAGDIWLIRGRNLDLLVDCGTGIVPLRPVVESISRNPVLAVACNCWYDHAGGFHEFDQRACHQADAPRLISPTPESSVASIYVSDDMLRALPRAGYSTASYALRGSEPTQLLSDGDVIDLGGRSLEILHVPGMTPGSIALWEQTTGSLFTSDTLFDDPSPESRARYRSPTAHDPSKREMRLRNFARLSRLPLKTVYAGHFGQISRKRAQELMASGRDTSSS